MQALAPIRHRFVSNLFPLRPRLISLPRSTAARAFSSSSSSSLEYPNQSRGGLPRFFSDHLPSSKGGVVLVQGDEFHHMTRVLRLTTDDRDMFIQMEDLGFLGNAGLARTRSCSFLILGSTGIGYMDFFGQPVRELFNGNGSLVEGCIQSISRAGVDVMALGDPKFVPYPSTKWHVFAAFGTLKGGRADWLVEKCSELGACSVTPLLTDHSPSISDNRVDRLQRVILAATKQCQRLHEMVLNSPTDVTGILPLIPQSKLSFLAAAEADPVVDVLASSRTEASGLIIIGPEGDFSEKEVNMMVKAGATTVGLGPLRLRVETATVALLAALMLWSDSQKSL